MGPGGEGIEVRPALRRPKAGAHFLVLLKPMMWDPDKQGTTRLSILFYCTVPMTHEP